MPENICRGMDPVDMFDRSALLAVDHDRKTATVDPKALDGFGRVIGSEWTRRGYTVTWKTPDAVHRPGKPDAI